MGMYCDVSAVSPEDLGTLSAASSIGDLLGSDTTLADGVSLEKAWHGLHFLLTGEPWGGQGPLAFLLAGGEHLDGDEDSPRWFTSKETSRIHQALSDVSDDALWCRFDATKMERSDIYPGVWDEDEEDLKEEYLEYFHELKRLVAAAAQSNRGLLVSIG